MIDRCTRPGSRHYHRYGGRGIRVCERWKLSFEAFLADMGERPSPRHSIDRIDNDGNYEPGNCRWATPAAQNRNRSSSHVITVSMCIEEWAEVLGVPSTRIRDRIHQGWPEKDALFCPKSDVQELADARVLVAEGKVEVQA